MKDQQIIDFLRERDAVFLDEITRFDGQVTPTNKKLDNQNLMNFEVSEIHSEFAGLSSQCVRRKIAAPSKGNKK